MEDLPAPEAGTAAQRQATATEAIAAVALIAWHLLYYAVAPDWMQVWLSPLLVLGAGVLLIAVPILAIANFCRKSPTASDGALPPRGNGGA